jgi:hypothetical protein
MGVSVEFSEYIEYHREVSTRLLVENSQIENDTYYLHTTVVENHLIWYYGDYEYLDSLNESITNGKYLKIYSSPDSELYKLS